MTETAEPGWDLTALECSEGEENLGTRTATLSVDPGDTITCTFENTKRASVTVTKTEAGGAPAGTWTFRLTGGPDNVDITKDTEADGNPLSFGNLKPGNYTLCEINMPAGWHSSLEEPPFNGVPVDNPDDTTTVCVAVVLQPGEAETFTIDNTMPSTLVVKEGTQLAHHGDVVTYTFDVSNTGNIALQNIVVTDDKCPNVSAVPVKLNSDADDLLENPGQNGTSSEVWRYTCSYTLPAAHSDGEVNPIVNTATATGEDIHGNPVSDTDTHSTRILHPDIHIDKQVRRAGDTEYQGQGDGVDGDVVAHVGETLEYRFLVTDGDSDTPIENVQFSDPRCDAGTVQGPVKSGGDQDAFLEPGETWTYTCSHVITAQDPDPLPNTGTVTGEDEIGGDVEDSDTTRVDVLHPDIEIDKQVRRAGDAEYQGQGDGVDGGVVAHVGETLEYRFLVTDGDSDTPIENVQFSDPRCDAGTVAGPVKSGGDQDAFLEPGETWTYTCSHVITAQDPDPLPNTGTVTGEDEIGGEVEDSDTTRVDVLHPDIHVDKQVRHAGDTDYQGQGDDVDGGVVAHVGETIEYRFLVTDGNSDTPIGNVQFGDPRCDAGTVQGPVKSGGDQDALLEDGETWTYTCSHVITAQDTDPVPEHRKGDRRGRDRRRRRGRRHHAGRSDPSGDRHREDGPGDRTVGAALAYTLTVTNPGDVPFASQQVIVTDPKCEAPPAGPNKGADATPGQLDPGDVWTYTCTAQTAGQPAGTFVNTANVSGTDFLGKTVTDTDDFPTVLEAQAVLPETPGSARLRGPSGCVNGPFTATVRGARIARVTFFVDGKRFRRITAPNGEGSRFTARINPRGRGFGVHRVTVRVEFATASNTSTRTLRLSFQRCRKQVVRPRFTG